MQFVVMATPASLPSFSPPLPFSVVGFAFGDTVVNDKNNDERKRDDDDDVGRNPKKLKL